MSLLFKTKIRLTVIWVVVMNKDLVIAKDPTDVLNAKESHWHFPWKMFFLFFLLFQVMEPSMCLHTHNDKIL